MAWSWSHTAGAYDNARANLEGVSESAWLIDVIAEWRMHDWGNPNRYTFNQEEWDEKRAAVVDDYGGLPLSAMTGVIWADMEQLRICDNGGFNAWCCPYGCHTVSFSKEEEGEG